MRRIVIDSNLKPAGWTEDPSLASFEFEFRGHTFKTSGELSGMTLFQVAASMDPNVPEAEQARAMLGFLDELVHPDQRADLLSVLRNGRRRNERFDAKNPNHRPVGIVELSSFVQQVMAALEDQEPESAPLDTPSTSSPGFVPTVVTSPAP